MQHPKIIYTDSSRIKFIRLVPWILIPHIFSKLFSKLFSITVECYKQLIYWDLFLSSQYMKYRCSNQIFRNTFQSDLKIKIMKCIDQIDSSIKNRTIIPILSRNRNAIYKYHQITSTFESITFNLQSQGKRLATHGSHQNLRTRKEEE